ncbi:MAG TPA: DUF4105 domain-containing protein [Nannocystis exedens]|nr:DUF4105 domain-containing protein [Nannocystis exedens]
MLAALRRALPLALYVLFVLFVLLSTEAAAAPAATSSDTHTEIHLITIGPGEHVLTSGGHSALMVATLKNGRADPAQTLIYNFGDADFEDPELPTKLLRGDAEFRLVISGTLQELVNDYGNRQGREIWRQKLNLSPAQATTLAEKLAVGALPENRNYPYHHHNATCTTKIRDLLDEVTQGALSRDLKGVPSVPPSARDMQPILWRKHHLTAVAADLFFGRIHDRAIDKYWALVDPLRMMQSLQEVTLTGTSSEPRPLAQAPVPLIQIIRPDVIEMPSITTPLLSILTMLLLSLGARRAYRKLPAKTLGAGLWLLLYPLISGLIGAAILALMIFSEIPELRQNENVLVFPATDLLLVGFGALWCRRPLSPGQHRLLWIYALARMALIITVIGLHIAGVLLQKPLIFIAMSFLFSAGLLALLGRAKPTAKHQ